MNLEYLLTAADVGVRHHNLAVEAARTQQRRVEDVGAVGGGDQDYAFVGLEAVHLDQQLVQRLLALVVTAAQARATVPADRVDLVDEDDAGRALLALLVTLGEARLQGALEAIQSILGPGLQHPYDALQVVALPRHQGRERTTSRVGEQIR